MAGKIEVGDTIRIHLVEYLCIGFGAKEQLQYKVGSTHKVVAIGSVINSAPSYYLEGNNYLMWREAEVVKVKS